MTEALCLAERADFIPSQATSTLCPADSDLAGCFLPVVTPKKVAKEAEHLESIELRAYKLGKKRWLYNECRLNITSESGFYAPLEIAESSRQSEDHIPELLQDCGVFYGIKLKGSSNLKLDLEIFVVFDQPHLVDGLQDQQSANMMGLAERSRSHQSGFQWPLVHRSECQKGCDGPILRSIQRYGRVSRRTGKKQPSEADVPEDRAKDPRHLYLSIDEASTHVGGKRFRLIAAVYEPSSRKLLGSCCSLPIQVLANNDAPNGPATIDLDISISNSWEGWPLIQESLNEDHQMRNNSAESLQREHYPLATLEEPSSSVHAGNSWYLSGQQPLNSKAKIDLQYIRERAMLSGEEDDGSLSFDDSLPAPKRTRSTFGLESDLALGPYYQRLDPAMPQLHPPSQISSMSTYLTPDRLRLEQPAPANELNSLDSTALHPRDLAATPMRHDCIADSTRGPVRHNSLPPILPDLSVMTSAGKWSARELSTRSSSGLFNYAQARYNSDPYHSTLLSELQAKRMQQSDSSDNVFWAGLGNPQSISSQGSAMRQASSPGVMLHSSSDSEAHPAEWSARGRPRVQQAQNPSLSTRGPASHIANPFAQQGDLRDEVFWGQQVQAFPKASSRRQTIIPAEKVL